MKLLDWTGGKTMKRLLPAGLPLLAVAIAAMLAVTLLATPAMAAEGKGTLKGSVTNLTKDGGSVSNLDVALVGYQGQDQKVSKTAKSGSDGKLSFTGLDTGADYVYQMSIVYQGVSYFSQPVNLTDDQAEQESIIPVFETTSSADTVKSTARHYLVEPDATGVDITEIVVVSNSSDRTYIGSKEAHPGLKETLRIAIPAGAQNVQTSGEVPDDRVFPLDGALVDTWPIYPGDSQRMYSYRIPAKDDAASFTTQVTMAADKVNVLMPDTGVEISVSNLGTRTSADMQGSKFVVITGQNVAAGTELQFKFNKVSAGANAQAAQSQPATGAQQGQPNQATPNSQEPKTSSFQDRNPLAATVLTLVWIVPVVAVIGVVAYFVLRRRKAEARKKARLAAAAAANTEDSQPRPAIQFDDADDLEAERQILVGAIAQLDDRFEQGEIGSEEYGRVRAQKKRRLVDVVARQRALTQTDEAGEDKASETEGSEAGIER